jgi:hypothetical protein
LTDPASASPSRLLELACNVQEVCVDYRPVDAAGAFPNLQAKSLGSAVIHPNGSARRKGAFAQLIGYQSKFDRVGLDRNCLLINDLTRSTELSCLGSKLSF